MKRKKILLMLSLAMMGVTTASLTNGFASTINANAYSTGVTVSEDGYTKSVADSYALTSADAGKKIYSEVDGLLIDQKSGKYLSAGKLTNIHALYFEIPDAAATGTVSITCAGSNTKRFVYYVDSNGAALTTGIKFSYAGSNKIVSNTFSSTDLVTLEGYEGKYFLGLSSNGTDYKFKNISVQLDSSVSKNFNGSLAEKHNVNYYSSDGLTQYTELTEEVEEGSSPTTSPVLDDVVGQNFVGWAAEVNGTTVVDPTTYTMETEDLNFYAIWETVTTHTVTITDYEGAEPRIETYNNSSTLELPNPSERTGYRFVKWVNAETNEEVTNETVVEGNLSIIGEWEEIPFVTFDANGGTFGESTEPVTVYANYNGTGYDAIVAPSEPTKEGFAFGGWALEGTSTAVETFENGKTYYAIWEELVYAESITIDGGDLTWDDVETPKTLTATIDTKGDTVNTDPVVTWSSSNEEVVTINSSTGALAYVGKGTSEITAKIYAGTEHEVSNTITVTVNKIHYVQEATIFTIQSLSDQLELGNVLDFFGDGSVVYNLKTAHKIDTTNASFDGTSLSTYEQVTYDKAGAGLELNLSVKSHVELYFTNTGSNDNRKAMLCEMLSDEVVAELSMPASKTAQILKADLLPGKYYLTAIDTTLAENRYKPVNFYGGKINADIYYDNIPLIAAQKGTVNETSAARFIGIIDKNAISFLENAWFVVNAIDENGESLIDNYQTTAITTVYKSIVYTDINGETVNWKYTNEANPSAEYYYFAWTLYGIPEDFKGTITAQAFVNDGTNNIVSQVVSLEY